MTNRIMILALLLGLLYALYRYQQQIMDTFNGESPEEPKSRKKIKNIRNGGKNKQMYKNNLIDEESMDDISLDNISQLSLGSLEGLQSREPRGYKQDSVLDSLDSDGSFSTFDDESKQSKDSFFFQQ